MFGSKKDIQYVIFHGKTIQLLSRNKAKFIESIQHIDSHRIKTVFLLGVPYINTFLHETTHLKKNELQIADELILPFSSTPNEQRSVSSVQLGYKKNLTLHSHLTNEGKNQIIQLKKSCCFSTWHPLVEFLTERYVLTQSEKSSLLLFSSEMLLLKYHNRQFMIRHIPHWNTFSNNFSFKNAITSHFQLEKCGGSSEIVNFKEELRPFSMEKFQTSFLNDLFFPQKRASLGSKKFLKKKFQTFSKVKAILSPFHVLSAVLSLLIIWNTCLYFSIYSEKNTKRDLTRQKEILTQDARKNEKSFKLERKTLEIEAYNASVQSLNSQPQEFLRKIERALPPQSWISNVELNLLSNQVKIIGPPSLKIDLVLENLEKDFTSIRLLSSQNIQAKEKKLIQYSIHLQVNNDAIK